MNPSDPLVDLVDRRIAKLIRQAQEIKELSDVSDRQSAIVRLLELAEDSSALATTIRTIGE